MVTPVLCCGFECGVFASSSHLVIANGTPTIDTTTFRTGARALRCAPSASIVAAFTRGDIGGATRWVGRVYIRFATLPDADTAIIMTGATASTGPQVRFKSADSKLYAAVDTTFGASGVSVTTGQWYRIDFDLNIQTAGNDVADAQVDGTACGQASGTGHSAAQNVRMGVGDTCTADLYMDDLILSQTAADYPIGAGFVKSYIPNADGTHNVAGANDFEFADGTDITNATTTAWTVVARRPLNTTESADYIEATAPPNSGDYVELQFEDSTEADAPRAVEVITAHTDAGGAGTRILNGDLRQSDGTLIGGVPCGAGVNTGSTVTYGRAHFADASSGGAVPWTTTLFNGVIFRLSCSDASPDPRLNAIMIEAEFPEAVAAKAPPPWRRPNRYITRRRAA